MGPVSNHAISPRMILTGQFDLNKSRSSRAVDQVTTAKYQRA